MHLFLSQTGCCDFQSPVLYWLALPGSVTMHPTSKSLHVISKSGFDTVGFLHDGLFKCALTHLNIFLGNSAETMA